MTLPTKPIFDLTDDFDGIIAIAEEIKFPIKVKRLDKTGMEEFTKLWRAYVDPGLMLDKDLPEAEKTALGAQHEKDAMAFFANYIRECITVPVGCLRDRGKDVTDGNGVLNIFHARQDILAQFVAQIWLQNRLVGDIVKNLKSLRDSDSGSTASVPTSSERPTGAGPVLTVASARSKDYVKAEDATDGNKNNPSGSTQPVH